MKEESQEEAVASRLLGQEEITTRCSSRTCRLTLVVVAAKDRERVLRRGRTMDHQALLPVAKVLEEFELDRVQEGGVGLGEGGQGWLPSSAPHQDQVCPYLQRETRPPSLPWIWRRPPWRRRRQVRCSLPQIWDLHHSTRTLTFPWPEQEDCRVEDPRQSSTHHSRDCRGSSQEPRAQAGPVSCRPTTSRCPSSSPRG